MMTARSLFETFIRIGMSAQEAYEKCMNQNLFSESELKTLLPNK